MEMIIRGETVSIINNAEFWYKDIIVGVYNTKTNKLTLEDYDYLMGLRIEFINTHPDDMFDFIMNLKFRDFDRVIIYLVMNNNMNNYNNNFHAKLINNRYIVAVKNSNNLLIVGYYITSNRTIFSMNSVMIEYNSINSCDYNSTLGSALIGKSVKSALH